MLHRAFFRCNVLSLRLVRHQSRVTSPYIASEIRKFDPKCGVEKAHTPPGSWYTEPDFELLEEDTVFTNNWIAVASTRHLSKPGDYISGFIGREPYLISMDSSNTPQYFYNICRHHGSLLCDQTSGCTHEFVCPYHAWKYSLNGRLVQATKMRGIENFKAKDYGLLRFNGTSFLNIRWLHKDLNASPTDLHDQLNPVRELLNEGETKLADLQHVRSQVFSIRSNWKAAIDNFIDGAYHVPICHKDLNSQIVDIDDYKVSVYDHYSVQSAVGDAQSRVSGSIYNLHIYPNVFINKYGKWVDVNYVIPTGAESCDIIFDWYYDSKEIDRIGPLEADLIINEGVKDSVQVQEEDNVVCERVQKGMRSRNYQFGRYSPRLEPAVYDFHCKLYNDYTSPRQSLSVIANQMALKASFNKNLKEAANHQQAGFCTLTGVPLTSPANSQPITNPAKNDAHQIQRTNHSTTTPTTTDVKMAKMCGLTGVAIDAGSKPERRNETGMLERRAVQTDICSLTGLPITGASN